MNERYRTSAPTGMPLDAWLTPENDDYLASLPRDLSPVFLEAETPG
jgi:hypothetical protein